MLSIPTSSFRSTPSAASDDGDAVDLDLMKLGRRLFFERREIRSPRPKSA